MAGGTEFFMQIETEMKGAAGASSELQELAESIGAMKAKYSDFERASTGTGKALDAVGVKIAALREKMSKSMAAGDMQSFWKDGGKLNALVAQEGALKVKADGAKKALESQGQALAKLASQYGKLKTNADEVAAANKHAEESAKGFQKSGDGLGKMGGPIGRLGQRAKDLSEGWNDLKANLGTTGAATAVGVVALAALTAVLVAGAVAAGKWALGLANAARNTWLTTVAIMDGEEAGGMMADAFSDITHNTGIASERLVDLTRDLKKAKVAASDMPAALEAIAMQEQALGDTSGTGALIDELKSGKKSATALADEMTAKFGGVVKQKMLGLEQQQAVLAQNFLDMFDGAPIEGFLQGMQKLIGLTDKNSQSMTGLRSLVRGLFSGLDWDSTFVAIEAFFLGAISKALDLSIAVKVVRNALGLQNIGKGWAEFPNAATLGSAAAYALLAPILMIGAAAAVAGSHLSAISKAAKAIGEAGSSLDKIINGGSIDDARGALEKGPDASKEFADSGKSAASAYSAAIFAAVPGAYTAGKLFSAAAHKGLKDGQEEHSPPRLFLRSGERAAEAYTAGIEEGTPAAHEAGRGLALAPVATSTSSSSGGGGASLRVDKIEINVHGVAESEREGLVAQFSEKLNDELEKLAIQLGVGSGEAVTT